MLVLFLNAYVMWVWLIPPSMEGGPYGTTWLGGVLFTLIGFCLSRFMFVLAREGLKTIILMQIYVFILLLQSWRLYPYRYLAM